MKIALLYICTGEYIVFWEDFYKSFEEKFLPEHDKEYFVFTDADVLPGVRNDNSRIHIYRQAWQPWPIPTLLKFHTFLRCKEELLKFDYIYQPNGNTRCNCVITPEEFLPRKELGEKLFFTTHPTRYKKKFFRYEYCTNRKSLAYVPWYKKATGVFGAMNGGESAAYIEMISELADRISEDLRACIIPRSHDEAYINNYIVRHKSDSSIRYLTNEYAYPVEWNLPIENRMFLENKSKYMDVETLKYMDKASHYWYRKYTKKIRQLLKL